MLRGAGVMGSWGRGILGQVGKRECREGRTSRLLDMNEMKLGGLASWEHSTQGPLSPGSRNIEAGAGKDPWGEVVGCCLSPHLGPVPVELEMILRTKCKRSERQWEVPGPCEG